MKMNYLTRLRSFLREFEDIHEHARTGRRPARRQSPAQTDPRP